MNPSKVGAWLLIVTAVLGAGGGCDKLKGQSGEATATADSDSADEDAPKKKKTKREEREAPTKTPKGEVTFDAPPASPSPGGVPLGPTPTAQTASSVDYFGANAATIPAKFKDRFPQGARALEIVVYKTYVFTEIQDAAQKLHVDRYQLREGLWRDPTPVKLIGPKQTEESIAAATFDPNEVVFAEIQNLAKDAPARLKVETPEVSHIMIRRPLPFEKDVRIRVFVTGPRSSGFVDYDKKGAFLKAHD